MTVARAPARLRVAMVEDGSSIEMLGGDPWTDAVELHRQLAYVLGSATKRA